MSNLSSGDRSMLAKVLGMLGSSHDGEVVNAARKAHEMLKAKGVTWPAVLGLDDMQQDQPAPEPYHLTLARELLGKGKGIITRWEYNFLIGIMGHKVLKQKQIETLDGIAAKIDAAAS